MLVSSYITPKARKGVSSAIQGRGLVAVAPIAADELVAIKGGHIVTSSPASRTPLSQTSPLMADLPVIARRLTGGQDPGFRPGRRRPCRVPPCPAAEDRVRVRVGRRSR